MDMVEKVANGLAERFMQTVETSSGMDFSATGVKLPSNEVWLGYACAAIEAMMEPSEGMLEADLRTKWPALYRDHIMLATDGENMRTETTNRLIAARKSYQAMIRSALESR